MRTGVDLISVKRLEEVIARHGERFLNRIFTEKEKLICNNDSRRFAGRYAAKEAVSKALGTGIGGEGIAFLDIEILRNEQGAPVVVLHGAAREVLKKLNGGSLSLSISHENDYAVAFCVLTPAVPPRDGTIHE